MSGMIPHRLSKPATHLDLAALILVAGVSTQGVSILITNLRKGRHLAKSEILEREKAEMMLQESALRYRGLFENSPVGIVLAGLNRDVLDLNPAALRMIDHAGEDGSRKFNFLTDGQTPAAGFSGAFARCAVGGCDDAVEDWYTARSGKRVYLAVQMAPMRDSGGSLAQVQIILHDLTGQKVGEQSLHDSRELYQILFEQSGDYAIVLDVNPGGIPKIVDANEAALRAHGYAREELIGQPITLVEPQNPGEVAERGSNGGPGLRLRFSAVHQRKDGSPFYVDAQAKKVEQDGRLVAISVERDITESQQNAQVLASVARISAVLRQAELSTEMIRLAADEKARLTRADSLAVLLTDGQPGRLRAAYGRGDWAALTGTTLT